MKKLADNIHFFEYEFAMCCLFFFTAVNLEKKGLQTGLKSCAEAYGFELRVQSDADTQKYVKYASLGGCKPHIEVSYLPYYNLRFCKSSTICI